MGPDILGPVYDLNRIVKLKIRQTFYLAVPKDNNSQWQINLKLVYLASLSAHQRQ